MKCIVMFSGGLDSVVAAHLLQEQGIEVVALHFVLPFESGVGLPHDRVRRYAESLGVMLRVEEEGEEFLRMVCDPEFGYGKHANPCIDCRIHRLRKAAGVMADVGASFIGTGEVVGQRPMSQRMGTLGTIDERAGLAGLVLRPLCAGLLPPTIPEKEGWVQREKLLSIRGRGRKRQIEYARRHGLSHGSPAGGCVLTEKEIARRFVDLVEHEQPCTLNDFKLLAYGRHFRIGSCFRVVVGRKESENQVIDRLFGDGDTRLEAAYTTGPLALGRGEATDDVIEVAAALVARYSRERGRDSVEVAVLRTGQERIVQVVPASPTLCSELRI